MRSRLQQSLHVARSAASGRAVRALVLWYATPSGAVFAAALALLLAALLTAGSSWAIAVAGLGLVGLFVPFKLWRERVITDNLLESLECRRTAELARVVTHEIEALNRRLGISEKAIRDVAESAGVGLRMQSKALLDLDRVSGNRQRSEQFNPVDERLCHAIEFDREDHAHVEEVDGVHRFFQHLQVRSGVMLDVGAHRGTSLHPFAQSGWSVHAFEPDAANRRLLLASIQDDWDVSVSDQLVSDESDLEVAFYSSPVSSGISSAIPFHESHEQSAKVQTTTLRKYMSGHDIDSVDFLKVDTEGGDLFVLSGFPFHRVAPKVVLCEFEDSKTIHCGYRTADMINFLQLAGFDNILVSEWHPIVKYGQRHDYSGLRVYDGSPVSEKTWGNLIAVRDPEIVPLLHSSLASMIRAERDE